ncbi:hypothetical protein BpHYR1_009113 [Brachionus plicatilis]|uniref:Uncharacterized protein n=1 Tax=Brachionus plicatilis TaxID=10195 RepID=A0A3M7SFJ9_BRAPC|nr:hypothetical protein BpHYR1_009113 [Brachionus plicatilis]
MATCEYLARFKTIVSNPKITKTRIATFEKCLSDFNNLTDYDQLREKNKSKNIKTHDEFVDALKNREKSDLVKYMNFGNTIDSHQVFIGPIMIHLNQDKQAYLTFAMELKNMIYCIRITLNEHKVFEEDQEKLIVEVFGKIQERQNSLLGSKDNNEFYSRPDSLITKLKEFKHPYRKTDLSVCFKNNMVAKIFENFCEIIWSNEHIEKNYYSTNEIEGINHKIKEFTGHKSKCLSEILDQMLK